MRDVKRVGNTYSRNVGNVPVIKLYSNRQEPSPSLPHPRELLVSTFVWFNALVPTSSSPTRLSRFAEHKIQPKRRIPRDFRGRKGRGEKDDGVGVGNSRPENRNFWSFHRSFPLFFPTAERFWQWRSRSTASADRQDLSFSKAPFGTSHRIILS